MLKPFLALAGVFALAVASPTAKAQVSSAGANWSSFLGSDGGTSFSTLDQINRTNVDRLIPSWMFAMGGPAQHSTPVVVDGTMYLTGTNDRVYAMDAVTGAVKWTYGTNAPVPRGSGSVVLGFGLVFYGRGDNHLIALDAATGREVWDVQIEDKEQCNCSPSYGILLAGDKVIVGVRGDFARRNYINAFDARTGRHLWRWWAVPGPGEPGNETWPAGMWKYGSAAPWYAGAYDPKLNLIYWGTGNPQPIMGGTDTEAKLWADSIVAIDAATGKMRWGFQETPADNYDLDSNSEPMLLDAMVDGKMTPLVVHSIKTGYTYVLHRETGKIVSIYRHSDAITINKGLDKAGKPIDPLVIRKDKPVLQCPSQYGYRAGNHGAYSPVSGLWYGSSNEICANILGREPDVPVEGRLFLAAKEAAAQKAGDPFIAGYEPVTGKRIWVEKTEAPNVASMTVTAGDLLFGTDPFGFLWARDARTGKVLWKYNLGSQSTNSPMTYSVGGRQYLAVVLGGSAPIMARIRELWADQALRMPTNPGSMMIVFALNEGK